jgi:DNA polymerase-3 subunit delta'
MLVNEAALPLPWLAAPLSALLHMPPHHALLVHGTAGSGLFEFADGLIAAQLCEADDKTPRPCGRCPGCHLRQAGHHPDLRRLVPAALLPSLGLAEAAEEGAEAKASKAKPSREIKVEAVREAIGWTQQSNSRGRGKWLLLHPADALNLVAANALLKTLEEPPPGVRLLLTSAEPDRLLPTVRSRCRRLALSTPAVEPALAWLKGQGVDAPEVLLRAAGGQPLLARSMAAEGVQAAHWLALPDAVAAGDAGPMAGWPLPRAVEALQKLCHDAMAAAVGGAPRYFPADRLPATQGLAPLAAWSKVLRDAARHDEHPWQAGLLVESLVLQSGPAWARRRPAGPSRGGRPTTLAGR